MATLVHDIDDGLRHLISMLNDRRRKATSSREIPRPSLGDQGMSRDGRRQLLHDRLSCSMPFCRQRGLWVERMEEGGGGAGREEEAEEVCDEGIHSGGNWQSHAHRLRGKDAKMRKGEDAHFGGDRHLHFATILGLGLLDFTWICKLLEYAKLGLGLSHQE